MGPASTRDEVAEDQLGTPLTPEPRRSRLMTVALVVGVILSACGGDSAEDDGSANSAGEDDSAAGDDSSDTAGDGGSDDTPSEDDSGGMDTIATLTIDGVPYTFVGVRGGSVLSDDFYCFVGTTGGMNATLALEGDEESELRFMFVPDEADPTVMQHNDITAVLPSDFEHSVRDGGQDSDFEILDFDVTDDSFSISANIAMVETVSGVEHEGILEATC